ncbi:MAG: allantoinase AllB [bacterium]
MKTDKPDLIIRGRRVVTPEGVRPAAVVIKSGKIVEVLSRAPDTGACPVEEIGDRVVMPGLIDAHVHINEPGRTEWEGFETATRAGAAGGITTIVDMPLNSTPVTTTVAAFEQKLAAAENKLWVDCGFYAGIVPGNNLEVGPLLRAGVLAGKAFLVHSGIDDFPNVTAADLRQAMPVLADHGLPLLVHAELQNHHGGFPAEASSYQAYLASRPCSWENDAIALMISLCREYHCRVHIVHLSSAEAVPILKQARAEGLAITVETCPHYLYFSAEEIPDGDTRFKCAPPIRARENRERLWQALQEGVIDFIASDHSPCPPQLKLLEAGDFQRAWGGIASLQLTLPVIWTAARSRGFSLPEMAQWLSHRPAKFLGMHRQKGEIASGHDADLVIWNPEASFTVTTDMMHHRHKITPYAGRVLQGVVEMTLLRGRKIYEDGRFIDGPFGNPILYQRKRI